MTLQTDLKKKFKKYKKEVTYKPKLKNCYKLIPELKEELANGTPEIKDVLNYAGKLEGCIRQTGVHACAMIIGRGNLTEYIPITLANDKLTGEEVWECSRWTSWASGPCPSSRNARRTSRNVMAWSSTSRRFLSMMHRPMPYMDAETQPVCSSSNPPE